MVGAPRRPAFRPLIRGFVVGRTPIAADVHLRLDNRSKEATVALTRRGGAKQVGITHFPLEQEAMNQEAVSPRGQAKQKGSQSKALPRKRTGVASEDAAIDKVADRTISSKGGKGGRTSGSRAALLSRRQSDRGRKSRKAHPLDLL